MTYCITAQVEGILGLFIIIAHMFLSLSNDN